MARSRFQMNGKNRWPVFDHGGFLLGLTPSRGKEQRTQLESKDQSDLLSPGSGEARGRKPGLGRLWGRRQDLQNEGLWGRGTRVECREPAAGSFKMNWKNRRSCLR